MLIANGTPLKKKEYFVSPFKIGDQVFFQYELWDVMEEEILNDHIVNTIRELKTGNTKKVDHSFLIKVDFS